MSDEQATLDDVLDAYVSNNPSPSKEALTDWIRRYPHYRRQLIDFTVNWARIEQLPSFSDINEVDEEALVQQGMTVVQKLLRQRREHKLADEDDERAVVTSLLAEGRKRNHSIWEIAKRYRLGVASIRKLDRRYISYHTIPAEVIAALAESTGLVFETVSDYLKGAPKLAPGMRYRTEQRPAIAEKQGFFEAIRSDTTMDEADRAYWLAFETGSEEE